MHYLLTSTLSIDEVMEKEPPYHYFNEFLAIPIQYHLIWLFLFLCLVLSHWLLKKIDIVENDKVEIPIVEIKRFNEIFQIRYAKNIKLEI